jgi:SAM-dependent methyltransferase
LKPQQYWETRLNNNYNLQQVGYYKLGTAYNKWLYRVRSSVLLKTLQNIGFKNTKQHLFEVGLGNGFYLNFWQKLGITHLTGVDIARTVVDTLSPTYPNYQILLQDIGLPLPATTPQYTLVHAADVLFHITNDQHYQQAIANIAQLLQPNGYFIFSEVFTNQLEQDTYYKVRPTNFIYQTLAQNGLKVVQQNPLFWAMHPPTQPTLIWKMLFKILPNSNLAGNILGAILYPIEQIALKFIKRSPALELVVCQKITN